MPESKLSVIYNWADEAALGAPVGTVPAAFPGPDRFRILLADNMGKAQALDTVLEAASLALQARGSRVCWVMLGGREGARLKAGRPGGNWPMWCFCPPCPWLR